jgi:hypothetical protein
MVTYRRIHQLVRKGGARTWPTCSPASGYSRSLPLHGIAAVKRGLWHRIDADTGFSGLNAKKVRQAPCATWQPLAGQC